MKTPDEAAHDKKIAYDQAWQQIKASLMAQVVDEIYRRGDKPFTMLVPVYTNICYFSYPHKLLVEALIELNEQLEKNHWRIRARLKTTFFWRTKKIEFYNSTGK